MKLRRVLAWVSVGAVIVVAIGITLSRYALFIPGWLTDWRDPIQPTKAIEWARPIPGNPSGAPRPPNIVLILADDLGWNDITRHGGVAGGTVPTPHIDGIAAAGVEFANGYAAHSSCAPSRAALLSGRYGTRFGFEFTPLPDAMGRITSALHNRDPSNLYPIHLPTASSATPARPFAELVMPGSEITLAEVLRDRGYHTIHIGKWHLGDTDAARPLAQGFDESLDMASGKYLPDDHPDAVNSRQDFDPIDQFLWATFRHAARWNGGPRFAPPGYITDYYTDAAIDAIAANRERPFFLYLAHWAVHTPLQALRSDYDALPHITQPRERVYAAMVRSLDRSVGRVLEALRTQGLENDTLVIFTSDNGGAGYIGIPGVNQPYR
ncbi:MAG: sulfatase-like hydrolase/transferase, partial [Pseudomonadales bacterium]